MLKNQTLYQLLKQDIQCGIWSPLQILTQQQLSQHYGVSRIPVRDALMQLQAEGWLIPHGKAGIQVPGYSAAEADELCQIRLHLEPLALQLAAPLLSFQQLGQAEDILLQLAQSTDLPWYARGEANWQFHRTLYQSCAKPHLLRLLDNLHQQVARYLGYQEQILSYQTTSADEHRLLIELLRKGDTDAACSLLRQHISEAGTLLIAYLSSHAQP